VFRWKTTEQILHLNKDGEYWDDNWMNYDSVRQWAPRPIPWKSDRPIRFEDVDLWEVISEESNMNGLIGVYAAYHPYAEYYVVTHRWSIIREFEGWMANERLEQFLIEYNVNYPHTDKSPTPPQNQVVEKKLIIANDMIK
jgi:myo-inositol catabolism protein IolC